MNALFDLVDWNKAKWVSEERYVKPRYRGRHTRCEFCGDRFKSGEMRQQIAVPWSVYAHQRCIPHHLPPDPDVITFRMVGTYHPLIFTKDLILKAKDGGEPRDGRN